MIGLPPKMAGFVVIRLRSSVSSLPLITVILFDDATADGPDQANPYMSRLPAWPWSANASGVRARSDRLARTPTFDPVTINANCGYPLTIAGFANRYLLRLPCKPRPSRPSGSS